MSRVGPGGSSLWLAVGSPVMIQGWSLMPAFELAEERASGAWGPSRSLLRTGSPKDHVLSLSQLGSTEPQESAFQTSGSSEPRSKQALVSPLLPGRWPCQWFCNRVLAALVLRTICLWVCRCCVPERGAQRWAKSSRPELGDYIQWLNLPQTTPPPPRPSS